MCQRVRCPNCEKPSYSGCGRHVEQVLGDVPQEQRCQCRERRDETSPQDPERSRLRRLFGF